MQRCAFERMLGLGACVLAFTLVVPACGPAEKGPAATSDGANAGPGAGNGGPEGSATEAGAETTAVNGEEAVMPGTMPVKPETMPQHVQVQHILIGFTGSVPGKDIRRTKEEARKLAYEILERARKGEDFLSLVTRYTDDSPPGIYGMSGVGVAPGPGEYPRDQMVPAFGNVGFNISPGNIGIADYDPKTSPYGWHIIKRLK